MTRRWTVLLTSVAAVGMALTVAGGAASDPAGYGRALLPGLAWLFGLSGLGLAFLAGCHLDRGRLRAGLPVLGFATANLVAGLLMASLQWAHTDPVAPDDPGATRLVALLWVVRVVGTFAQLSTSWLLLTFPDGRFLPGRWGLLGRLSILGSTVSATMQSLAPGTLDPIPQLGETSGSVLTGEHVLGLPATAGWLAPAAPVVLAAALFVFLPVQLASTVIRFRRSSGAERDQLYWPLGAVVGIAVCVLATSVLLEGRLDSWVVALGGTALAVSMGASLLDQQRLTGQAVLAGTTVYGTLWVGILLLDVLVLTALGEVAGDALAQRDVVLVVLLFSALVYGPLRAALWRFVRRWLLGRRDDPYDVVAGLARGLEAAEEGPAQLDAVARAISQTFGAGFVSVEVDRPSGGTSVVTLGTRPRETRSLPISYRGAEVGRLVLPQRGVRTTLSRRDERLLGDLVRQAALAARTTQLADELQDHREELVLAREEERRRIRRDLHDGLGPALGGAVFQLDSARLLVDRDPVAAEAQLAATETHLRGVVDEVRRLVSDLRPPSLDALGLVGAVRQQAQLLPGVAAHVEVPHPLPALPAAVEVAALRIVGEALTNVGRHAGARRCTVRLEVEAGRLLVEVVDDGRGIARDRRAGVGLLSLRERAEELGGRTAVTCPAEGGTVLRAWLPLIEAPAPVTQVGGPDPTVRPTPTVVTTTEELVP